MSNDKFNLKAADYMNLMTRPEVDQIAADTRAEHLFNENQRYIWASVKTAKHGHRRVRAERYEDRVYFITQGVESYENDQIIRSLTPFQLRKIIANTMEAPF